MKILKNEGKAEIINIQGEISQNYTGPLKIIEKMGRVAWQSQDKETPTSCEDFVRMLIKKGHESVLEHSSMTVLFSKISRGFTHEMVRHRLAAFTQESTRYVDKSDFEVVCPPERDEKEHHDLEDRPSFTYRQWMKMNEAMYKALREAGWPAQDARQVLPIGIRTQIGVTTNLREWRHIFRLRTAKAAHWEIRTVMRDLLKQVQKRVPVIFEDIKVEE